MFTSLLHLKKCKAITIGLLSLVLSVTTKAQLGVYSFTGTGACPNPYGAVNAQPANAVFSNFTSLNTTCIVANDVYKTTNLTQQPNIDATKYFTFGITANSNIVMDITSISFDHFADQLQTGNTWYLRSSLDGYTADIATGGITATLQTAVATLPAATFSNLTAVTFRLYVVKQATAQPWTIDEVKINGVTKELPPIPGTPTSNSPQCSVTGVTLTAATPPTDITWYWQTAANGVSTANSNSTYTVNTSGTYYLRARNNITQVWSTGSSSITVVANPDIATPIFTIGATSSRCQAANNITYTATSTNATSISYSLDATSIAAGNTINGAGVVSYDANWVGTSIITATAQGCNGPKIATHTVTTTSIINTPVFSLGTTTTTRCQGAGLASYIATATFATSIVYSLDAASMAGGVSINASTGAVVFNTTWVGTTTITATANGCGGPKTAMHTVTITPTVSAVAFTTGATSTRCQGVGTVSYTATATNTTGITYSLNAASITAGNTINSSTGVVTYAAAWNGTTIITASAAGCNGPITTNHTVTITPTVGTPVFTLGVGSVRDQGTATILYTATATNSTSITYSLDASSIAGGNTINSTTGAITWSSNWAGVSTITATAQGCNGPVNSVHIVSINSTIVQAPLYLSEPNYALDRIDPVANNLIPTSTSSPLATVPTGILADNTMGIVQYNINSSFSYTTGNGAHRLMLVGISTSNRLVTSVTYGNIPLTLVGEENTNAKARVAIFSLKNPPSGTATLAVNFNFAPTDGAIIGVSTFTGVDQNIPYGNFYSYQDTKTTNPNMDVPSATGELVFGVIGSDVDPSVGSSQIQKWDNNAAISGAGSTQPGATTTATTTNMDWYSAKASFAIGAVSIRPAASNAAITYTLTPALCNDLVIKAQPVQALIYVKVTNGTMPANPAITATIKYGNTNTICVLTNPVYNSTTRLLTFNGAVGADVTVPNGQALQLQITTAQSGVEFQIEYHSASKPSRISLLPIASFVDFVSLDVFSAPYPGGLKKLSGKVNTTYYVRAKVTTPYGYKDITGLSYNFAPVGGTIANVVCVDSSSCTRTYEYAWTTPATTGLYSILATAKEGYENSIKNSDIIPFDICNLCPPAALPDSATGSAGSPITLDVLANDYDPNENIKVSTLGIVTQPNNGTVFIKNNRLIYLPNGTFTGRDSLTYTICDSTNLCATAKAYFTITPLVIDPCSESTKTHTYFIPYPEDDAHRALVKSANQSIPSNNIRTVISLTIPYPNMQIRWDEWEDGYEANTMNPTQTTTKVWGDGNPYNGVAPGYPNDIIPAGGSIVLDNTMPANPRVASSLFYDGKDKITSSGQIAVTQVCGEPTWMPVQAIKTNVTSTADFGRSFTVPLGENFNNQDFKYTALFIRAELDNTSVDIDKNNDGIFESTINLNQGNSYLVDGGVNYGATVTSNNPIGVELNSGGVDNFSIRNAPIYPATWYSNVYFTPVPTSDNAVNSPKDTSVVMLYNSLSRPLNITWNSGLPATGTINLPAKSAVRFPLAYSTTAAYKFSNPTGESFTAIEIVDSYSPNYATNGGNNGLDYDWSFNLISEIRLTDYATTAWAPGGLDLVAPAGPDVNSNPVWVTPNVNTTIYVKWDGNVSGTTGTASPCGLRYDVAYPVNALNYIKLRDPNDNDQSGIAVYTCNGAKIAAVYGEDAAGAGSGVGLAYWDVGSTILPFCKQKLIFANDDYARTLVGQPVTIPVLTNDAGFLAVIDPASVSTLGLLQPKNGTTTVNANGTINYTPFAGYVGKDTFEYRVCSTPSPVVCDVAYVYIDINSCPAPPFQNLISGQVFNDRNEDGINNDGRTGIAGPKVYLYVDGNCNGAIDVNELKDSVTVDASGAYQFITYPEKNVTDNFDESNGSRSCANGSDGNAPWLTNWADAGDPSTGFCNTTQSVANTDCEIIKDGTTNAIRLKDNNVSANRSVNLSGASYALLSFSYKRKSATLASGEDVFVQASNNGTTYTTIFTINGDGTADANYIDVLNQDIILHASATTYIRFLTGSNVDDADTVYIDNVKIQYLKYPQCYITRLDPSTVPQYHHTTSALVHTMTATSSQNCLAPFDFGVAKDRITLSGRVLQDANGLVDNQVNGVPIANGLNATLYAYLTDSTGLVVKKAIVNPTTSAYSFADVEMLSNYTVSISLLSVNPGDATPSFADPNTTLFQTWLATGEMYGVNNVAGSGVESGAPNSSIMVKTGTVNIIDVNFALEKIPNSDEKFIPYPLNEPDVQYDITGGLTGTDPEDGVLTDGRTYKITSLPFAAILYYNSLPVTLNQVITNFNSALLKVDPDDDVLETYFNYASQDAAGVFDPSPARVTIIWASFLLVHNTTFKGVLQQGKVNLTWNITPNNDVDYFEVEKSLESTTYTSLEKVIAKSTTDNQGVYATIDAQPSIGVSYYRLKIVDKQGKFSYSQVITIKNNQFNVVHKIVPNPIEDKLTITMTLAKQTPVKVHIVDMNGKIVVSQVFNGTTGTANYNMTNLEKLAAGTYTVKVYTNQDVIVGKVTKK